jgi:DNA-directed RNA polymerase specialized sigma24 family protein
MSNSASVADDISRDVFLVLLRGEARLNESRGSLRALLLGIARNLLWKRWRAEQRWSSLEDEEFVASTFDLDALSMQKAVGAAVAALPPLQREALILATEAKRLDCEINLTRSRRHDL